MILSIIIPVYNAEKYLRRCLSSIVLQDIKSDFEVILINDGSIDQSLLIAQSFENQLVNYHIINQQNKGASYSRNCALQIASGEFIAFLDSDDFYDKDSINSAIEVLEREKLDILYLRLKQVDETGNFIRFGFDLPKENTVFQGLYYDRRSFPATIYRREIIGNINFPIDVLIGEDSVFNCLAQSKAKRVLFSKEVIYNYTYRPNSLSTKGFSCEAFQGFIQAIKIISNFKKENFHPEDMVAQKYFENIIIIFITRIVDWNILPLAEKKRFVLLCKVLADHGYAYLLTTLSKDYKYIDQSFTKFMLYQKQLRIKSKIYQLIVPKKK